MNSIFSNIKGDKVIWAVVILLSLSSTLAVYSSISTLAYKSASKSQEIFMVKHIITLILGLGLMYWIHTIKYTYFSRISQLAYWLSIPLLLVTLVMGTNLNSASRWLTIPGVDVSFQTSDLAKLALIMYVARLVAKKQGQVDDFKQTFMPIMIAIFVVCGLILPANFSTAAVLFATCMLIMFVGRINIKYLLGLVGSGIVLFSLFVAIALNSNNEGRIGTWKKRIENFSNDEVKDVNANYQVNQAKIAIATGGWSGKGPGKSTQRNFLPHPYSDFIYAFIIEEYGLGGGIFILFLYLTLLLRTIIIASKIDNPFGTFLALGCCFLLVFQAMINMAVGVHLFPVTGQPLPFLSKGGTSFMFTGIAIGIILSVSRGIETSKKEKTEKGGQLAAA